MKQGLDSSDIARILKRLDKIELSLDAIRQYLIRSLPAGEQDLHTTHVPFVAGNKDDVTPLVSLLQSLDVSRSAGRRIGGSFITNKGVELKVKIKKSRKNVKR